MRTSIRPTPTSRTARPRPRSSTRPSAKARCSGSSTRRSSAARFPRAEHARLEPDKQVMDAPNGYPIVGIGGCAIGQSFCTKTPALACYTCPKFMFLRDDVEVHRNALAAAQGIVREFLEAAPTGRNTPAFAQLRQTIEVMQAVITEIEGDRFVSVVSFPTTTYTALIADYRKVAETPGSPGSRPLRHRRRGAGRALEPERHRRRTGHQDLPVEPGHRRQDPRRDQSPPSRARRGIDGCGRPAPRLARSGAGSDRQASDCREEDPGTRGQQRGASDALPRDLLLSQRAVGDHGGRRPQCPRYHRRGVREDGTRTPRPWRDG